MKAFLAGRALRPSARSAPGSVDEDPVTGKADARWVSGCEEGIGPSGAARKAWVRGMAAAGGGIESCIRAGNAQAWMSQTKP